MSPGSVKKLIILSSTVTWSITPSFLVTFTSCCCITCQPLGAIKIKSRKIIALIFNYQHQVLWWVEVVERSYDEVVESNTEY